MPVNNVEKEHKKNVLTQQAGSLESLAEDESIYAMAGPMVNQNRPARYKQAVLKVELTFYLAEWSTY